MRAAQISAIILGIVGVIAGAIGVFYWVAGALGVIAQALFGAAYIGVAVANAHTLLLVLVMILASLLTLAERKWSALMQDRIGPNRARFDIVPGLNKLSLAGLPHFLADGIKMLTKEDFVPREASKGLFTMAPMIAFGAVFLLFAVVPIAPVLSASDIPGIAGMAASMGVSASFPVTLQVVPNLEIGLLYVFAFASLAVYGTAIAGWASNNRFATLGSIRAASQMIAYEVALGLSLVGTMMIFGSLKLEEMTAGQTAGLFGGALPAWGIFLQPLGFLLFFVASLAETKRAPFDAPEGESEIIGYFVEYSGMRFGMFMISEFIEIVVLSGITVAIFFGGFHLPLPPAWGAEAWLASQFGSFGLAIVLGMTFVLKVILLCWVQLAIRWTMPRFRYDQIQTLGWKILLPIGLGNVFLTGVLLLVDESLNWLAIAGLAQLIFVIGLTVLYPSKKPTTIRHAGRAAAQPAMPHGH